QKTFDDLNLEIAGQDVGRSSRFLPEDRKGKADADQRKEQEASTRRMISKLQEWLNDPEYAAAWNRADTVLDNLQTKLTKLSDQLAERIERLEDVVGGLEDNTATTDDSALVFRNAEGQLVGSDGEPLSPDDAAKVTNSEHAQSYEQYRDAQDALRKAREKQDRYSDMQRDVQRWRDRLNDPDNPMTLEEIEEMERQFGEWETEIHAMNNAAPNFVEATTPLSSDPNDDPKFTIQPVIF
ncbi:MAG: hypothetical protein AAGC95_11825, partial [Pseudomonadota bacterium]